MKHIEAGSADAPFDPGLRTLAQVLQYKSASLQEAPMGLFDMFRAGPSVTSIDVHGLKAKLDAGDALLIDVRSPGEYASGHVAQARSVPLDVLSARAAELPKDKEILVICQSGGRSMRASEMLAQAGLKPVNIAGGTGGWIAAGFPVARG